ncbi:MAG: hypothetical protein U9Q15_01110 [Patescibacteria group bacterium]|nr:hypothetical protein [Patescibacteria group bacterium]
MKKITVRRIEQSPKDNLDMVHIVIPGNQVSLEKSAKKKYVVHQLLYTTDEYSGRKATEVILKKKTPEMIQDIRQERFALRQLNRAICGQSYPLSSLEEHLDDIMEIATGQEYDCLFDGSNSLVLMSEEDIFADLEEDSLVTAYSDNITGFDSLLDKLSA